MLKEILESQGKWTFKQSNPQVSGAPAITIEYEEGLAIIAYDPDEGYIVTVIYDRPGNEEWAGRHDGSNGFEDLIGPQGDYSSVELYTPSLKEALKALKAEFKIDCKKKDYLPLVMAAAGL